ncbi:unnamed protein product [Mytilus coruscus]|uniref:MEGF10_11 n=1 Tax=Mytilus coruscus TaxID=42192 RepID=A0A6J8BVH8_MYTCO|nr:unnamed protein product [Mytilus coruscus]
MKLYILLLTQLLIIFGNRAGFSQKSDGICYSDSVGYEMCCSHFELIDYICKECEIGYYRITTAKKCEPCPSHLYGKKCASVCKCKENERCDSKNGTCIPWTSTIGTLSEHSTVMQYQNQSTGENERRLGANHTRYIASTNYALLIYMILAGLIIMVLCAVAAVYKYQNKQKNVPQSFPKYGVIDSTPPPIIARSMQPSVFIEVDNRGGAYELIDDNNVLNLGN